MTDDAFQRRVEDAQMQGWTVQEYTNERAVLVKRSMGSLIAHIAIAVLTVWWSFGAGNLAYLLFKYFVDYEKWEIHPEGQPGDPDGY